MRPERVVALLEGRHRGALLPPRDDTGPILATVLADVGPVGPGPPG